MDFEIENIKKGETDTSLTFSASPLEFISAAPHISYVYMNGADRKFIIHFRLD